AVLPSGVHRRARLGRRAPRHQSGGLEGRREAGRGELRDGVPEEDRRAEGAIIAPMSTIPRFFLDRVSSSPDVRAWSAFVDGAWRDFTWRDYERRARGVGLGLVAAGLRRGDVVA